MPTTTECFDIITHFMDPRPLSWNFIHVMKKKQEFTFNNAQYVKGVNTAHCFAVVIQKQMSGLILLPVSKVSKITCFVASNQESMVCFDKIKCQHLREILFKGVFFVKRSVNEFSITWVYHFRLSSVFL